MDSERTMCTHRAGDHKKGKELVEQRRKDQESGRWCDQKRKFEVGGKKAATNAQSLRCDCFQLEWKNKIIILMCKSSGNTARRIIDKDDNQEIKVERSTGD